MAYRHLERTKAKGRTWWGERLGGVSLQIPPSTSKLTRRPGQIQASDTLRGQQTLTPEELIWGCLQRRPSFKRHICSSNKLQRSWRRNKYISCVKF